MFPMAKQGTLAGKVAQSPPALCFLLPVCPLLWPPAAPGLSRCR